MIAQTKLPGGPRALAGGRLLVALVLAATAVACNIPTEVPIVESRWIVQFEETSFGVDQLIPGDVSIAPDSSAFIVVFDTVAFSRTLGELCGTPCTLVDGMTVPKPPFVASFDDQIDFPPEVYDVQIESGEVELELANGMPFDPIRPSASGPTGTMTLRITDDADGDVLGELVVDGADTAFDPGTTLTRTLMLSAASLDGAMRSAVIIDSPLGDDVMVDVTDSLGVVVRPGTIRVTDVTVDVAGRVVSFDAVDLDVDGVDAEFEERILGGAFVLEVTNPFGFQADFDLTISAPGVTPLMRSETIGTAPTSTIRFDFTGDELRSFLGEPNVLLTGQAVVDAGTPILTILPGQELVLDLELEFTVELGGSGS